MNFGKSNQLKRPTLYTVLNWGLGHATRSAALLEQLPDEEVVIASDGIALDYLRQRFPEKQCVELPSLQIRYGRHAMWSIFRALPHIGSWLWKDYRWLKQNRSKYGDLISDGRLAYPLFERGTRFVNHQLASSCRSLYSFCLVLLTNVLRLRKTTLWFPGKTAMWPFPTPAVKELGCLSAIHPCNLPLDLDVLVVLSSNLEVQDRLLKKVVPLLERDQLKYQVVGYKGETSGLVGGHLTGQAFDALWSRSKSVVSFLGYSTLMDVEASKKPAFLVAIRGQWEQEALARVQTNSEIVRCFEAQLAQDNYLAGWLKKVQNG